MAFIPIPNSVQLCFDFVTAGQNWQFCIVVKKNSGAPTTGDLSTLTNEGIDWYTDLFKTRLSNAVQMRQTRATDMTAQGAPQFIQANIENGTVAQPPLPLGTPIVVSSRTENRGRSYRGRSYVSGLPETVQADATDITSGAAANILSDFGDLLDRLATLGFTWVVASKQHNGSVVSPAATTPVTAFVVDTHLDSQRRRLFGRGT